MHHRAIDLTGQKFGRLTATCYAGSDGRKSLWLTICECGSSGVRVASELRKGKTKSCGCLSREVARAGRTTHGMSRHPAFAVWRSMVGRCTLPTHQAWHNYGGRGIRVCRRWRKSFSAFWEDMGPTYSAGLTLDRKDNSKGYTPCNCAWATYTQQARNRRGNVLVQTPWGRVTVAEAAQRSGINVTTLLYRLAHGVPPSQLLKAPDIRNRFSIS